MTRKSSWQTRQLLQHRVDGRERAYGKGYVCAGCDFKCFTRKRWVEHQASTGHNRKGAE